MTTYKFEGRDWAEVLVALDVPLLDSGCEQDTEMMKVAIATAIKVATKTGKRTEVGNAFEGHLKALVKSQRCNQEDAMEYLRILNCRYEHGEVPFLMHCQRDFEGMWT
jgi:hypothetical protein